MIYETNEKISKKYMGKGILLEEIGQRLRDAIMQSGMSQKAIAEKIGIHPSTVNKYIRSDKFPSIDTFARLCKALNDSSDTILGLNADG